jgi:hypothetical protein
LRRRGTKKDTAIEINLLIGKTGWIDDEYTLSLINASNRFIHHWWMQWRTQRRAFSCATVLVVFGGGWLRCENISGACRARLVASK